MKLKKSFALEPELYRKLEKFAKEYGFESVAIALNYLLDAALNLPTELSAKLSKVCDYEFDRLNSLDIGYDELYANSVITQDLEQIIKLQALLNKYASLNTAEKELNEKVVGGSMRRSDLARGYGYALFPRDWVVLNEEYASSSKYAYVFEARNGEKYNVPHFIYFSNICYWDSPARDAECDKMDELIKAYSDDCANAFKCQVENKYEVDETGRTVWLNQKEWDASFAPAHFSLPIKGSTLPYCDKEFPFGAHIVRPEGYDFEKDNQYMKY